MHSAHVPYSWAWLNGSVGTVTVLVQHSITAERSLRILPIHELVILFSIHATEEWVRRTFGSSFYCDLWKSHSNRLPTNLRSTCWTWKKKRCGLWDREKTGFHWKVHQTAPTSRSNRPSWCTRTKWRQIVFYSVHSANRNRFCLVDSNNDLWCSAVANAPGFFVVWIHSLTGRFYFQTCESVCICHQTYTTPHIQSYVAVRGTA